MNSRQRAEELTELEVTDEQLLYLLNQRAELFRAKQESERSTNLEQNSLKETVGDSRFVQRLQELNQGPLTDEQVEGLFREIESCCSSLQNPTIITFQARSGTPVEDAALQHFGTGVSLVSQATVNGVFRSIEKGTASYGIVPVEGNIDRSFSVTLDCFLQRKVKICGEVPYKLRYAILARPHTPLDAIDVVYGQADALNSCRDWLQRQLPHVQTQEVASGSEAVQYAQDRKNSAAIASKLRIEQFQLEVLQDNIEDETGNYVRYVILGSDSGLPSGKDKTSIIVSSKDVPGALYRILSPFQKYNISLSRIETRPIHSDEVILFFLDFEGHESEKHVQKALSAIEQVAKMVNRLGSYPKASTQGV